MKHSNTFLDLHGTTRGVHCTHKTQEQEAATPAPTVSSCLKAALTHRRSVLWIPASDHPSVGVSLSRSIAPPEVNDTREFLRKRSGALSLRKRQQKRQVDARSGDSCL
ncbi:MAG: hypothetical protein ABEI52_08155 [Halobacteriaceae archaeon]